jgi:hypothetical protein
MEPTRIGNVSMSEVVSRPGAKGHRFGPDLSCSECGVTWDAHQVDPRDCLDEINSDSPLDRDTKIESAASKPKAVGVAAAASAALHARALGTD